MSDSIRTDEIEKFLSSVRGFVSSQSATPQRRRVKSELLVLTPANRVNDDAEDGDADTAETPVEYSRVTSEPMSNVWKLDTGKPAERETLEATIAELEAAVTEQPDDWQPDEGQGVETDDWTASAFDQPIDDSSQPVVEAEITPISDDPDITANLPPTPDQQEPADGALNSPEIAAQIAREVAEAFGVREVARNIMNDMEDDTLRVMVTEIIREELAGELGEKITRNVRKLVRREINRAFMARGLD
ncbi:MAG: hypothetical protein AAF801_10855 [Pseudomonadota bacterium]